ncbi:uncharacterized protein LOC114239596 [Bombyx mandarina]|uniref:Uncharacterized protein LOC114239596 n=1 Tax=Bombyx mandarina TaxID=7092 RepID=A0A6J2J8E0_BOMMA|nr:uncharacterized protein LOC114239596 [Bombyx mandarina]
MKEFKYDVVTLIQSVRDRPCLWDKALESYKDRVERKAAWEEIYNILDDRYEEMTPAEKRLTEEHVVNKWTNVRDTFVKTLKTKMGRPKRKYVFHEHLKFLTKGAPEETAEYSEFRSGLMKQEDESILDSSSQCYDKSDSIYTPKKKRKRESDSYSIEEYNYKRESKSKEDKQSHDETNDIDFVEVDTNDPRVMNEDEAFFASLLPSVVRYDEDERLEFRIEVLAVMKKIKEKRKWTRID